MSCICVPRGAYLIHDGSDSEEVTSACEMETMAFLKRSGSFLKG